MTITQTATCGRCGAVKPLHLLDTILLDSEGACTSDAAYCQPCFPQVKKIAFDVWTASDDHQQETRP